MQVLVSDVQVVGETEGTLFDMFQQGDVMGLFILENSGENVITYSFQAYSEGDWVDMDDPNTDLNDELAVDEVRSIKIDSENPKVRLRGSASGGSELTFSCLRHFDRDSGGSIPILSL